MTFQKGYKQTKEHTEKIRQKLIGRVVSTEMKEHLLEISSNGKGKKRAPFSAKWIKNLSESHKGHLHSEEQKRKIGLGNKGKIISKKTREKIGLAHKGKIVSLETRKKIGLASLGRKPSIETIEKIRQKLLGQKRSEEQKQRYSESKLKLGDKNPVKRLEVRQKISATLMGRYIGELSPSWKGGKNKTGVRRRDRVRKNGGSYSLIQWEQLKKKYNYMCLCCKKVEPEIKLVADHIIPVSKGGNSNIENIQPLCFSCNARKHTKDTNYISIHYQTVDVPC
jgi:5-methylcytosine-specific restriction endonuclease McrA